MAGVEEAVDVGTGEEEVSIDMSERRSCGNLGSIDTCQSQSGSSVDSGSIDTSPSPEAEFPSHPPKCPAVDIPVDSDGCAENPDAYRLWQPKKIEEEGMSAEEWQERWAKLRERLSMSKT